MWYRNAPLLYDIYGHCHLHLRGQLRWPTRTLHPMFVVISVLFLIILRDFWVTDRLEGDMKGVSSPSHSPFLRSIGMAGAIRDVAH